MPGNPTSHIETEIPFWCATVPKIQEWSVLQYDELILAKVYFYQSCDWCTTSSMNHWHPTIWATFSHSIHHQLQWNWADLDAGWLLWFYIDLQQTSPKPRFKGEESPVYLCALQALWSLATPDVKGRVGPEVSIELLSTQKWYRIFCMIPQDPFNSKPTVFILKDCSVKSWSLTQSSSIQAPVLLLSDWQGQLLGFSRPAHLFEFISSGRLNLWPHLQPRFHRKVQSLMSISICVLHATRMPLATGCYPNLKLNHPRLPLLK